MTWLRLDNCCSELGCRRPARHAHLCGLCYLGATPAVRALCNLIDGQPTQPVDSVAVAECCALEALLDVPWREDLRPAA